MLKDIIFQQILVHINIQKTIGENTIKMKRSSFDWYMYLYVIWNALYNILINRNFEVQCYVLGIAILF